MTEPHLFVLDAEGSRAASAAGDFILMCTCGLPEQNQRHLSGIEGVVLLITKKHEERAEITQALQALYLQHLRLEVRAVYPTARYIGVNWEFVYDSGRTFASASDTDVWDPVGKKLNEESSHGWDWLYDLCDYQLGEDECDDAIQQVFDLEAGQFLDTDAIRTMSLEDY